MTKKIGRYNVHGNEDFEYGSNNQVLKNYLNIKSKKQIEIIEAQELERVETELIALFDDNHQFTAKDLCQIHKKWLGDIYPSAGKYRSVNMQKDDFLFATANQIAKLMQKLENEFLKKYTPCRYNNTKEIANAIGIVHVEFIVIHPFREGNGRTARLLADLMSMQSNSPPLDYSAIDQTQNKKGFVKYVSAIHAGLDHNYEPIIDIFFDLISQSK